MNNWEDRLQAAINECATEAMMLHPELLPDAICPLEAKPDEETVADWVAGQDHDMICDLMLKADQQEQLAVTA